MVQLEKDMHDSFRVTGSTKVQDEMHGSMSQGCSVVYCTAAEGTDFVACVCRA